MIEERTSGKGYGWIDGVLVYDLFYFSLCVDISYRRGVEHKVSIVESSSIRPCPRFTLRFIIDSHLFLHFRPRLLERDDGPSLDVLDSNPCPLDGVLTLFVARLLDLRWAKRNAKRVCALE